MGVGRLCGNMQGGIGGVGRTEATGTLQLSTTPPRSFPHNPNSVFDKDMADFRVKREGLRWDFIIPTTCTRVCLGFPFKLPFVCFHKTLLSNHTAAKVGSQFSLCGVCQDLVGVCLHKLQ